MKALDKQKAPKKSINLTINSDLQTRSKEPNIDLPSTLEAAPKQALSGRHEIQWVVKMNHSHLNPNYFLILYVTSY